MNYLILNYLFDLWLGLCKLTDNIFCIDFYDWNRVKLRYCDGASFAGDSDYHNGVSFPNQSTMKSLSSMRILIITFGLVQDTQAYKL